MHNSIDEAERPATRNPLSGPFCGINEIVEACAPMGSSFVQRHVLKHPLFPAPLVQGPAPNGKRVWASAKVSKALDQIAAEGLMQ